VVRGILDPHLSATLSELAPMSFSTEADEEGIPAQIRAASAVRRHRGKLLVVQDDVNALAIREAGGFRPILLPRGPGGRRAFDEASGTKHHKMDLEAAVGLPDGRLVIFGSGSTPLREQVVVVGEGDEVRVVDGAPLYAVLRGNRAFSGSELNVEGAVVIDGALRLFQRGNGAPRDGYAPVDATADLPLVGFLAWLDRGEALRGLRRVVHYDLGEIAGTRAGFTDAALTPDGRVVVLACAEASPDAVRDGAVAGCRFGVVEDDRIRLADIRLDNGQLATCKLEGIEPRPGGAGVFDVVADVDRADQPALLGRLDVHERR
jgi:hypothetical protein